MKGNEEGGGGREGRRGGWSRLGPYLVLSVQVLESETCTRLVMNVCVT